MSDPQQPSQEQQAEFDQEFFERANLASDHGIGAINDSLTQSGELRHDVIQYTLLLMAAKYWRTALEHFDKATVHQGMQQFHASVGQLLNDVADDTVIEP